LRLGLLVRFTTVRANTAFTSSVSRRPLLAGWQCDRHTSRQGPSSFTFTRNTAPTSPPMLLNLKSGASEGRTRRAGGRPTLLGLSAAYAPYSTYNTGSGRSGFA